MMLIRADPDPDPQNYNNATKKFCCKLKGGYASKFSVSIQTLKSNLYRLVTWHRHEILGLKGTGTILYLGRVSWPPPATPAHAAWPAARVLCWTGPNR